ncbi:hypothetical protein ACFT54_09750 [Streptomyces cinereoruber]|uniref:hypothetical protein n=1 Tax=Streptomyces cinereoruber TaxID=67260 RepID=UPI00363EA85A
MSEPNEIVMDAIKTGLTGDRKEGLDLLQPLVDEGPATTFAVLVMLAGVATYEASKRPDPTSLLIPVVFGPDRASFPIDEAPPAHRFVVRLLAAVARADYDAARELFQGYVAEHDRPGSEEIGRAVRVAYRTALMTTRQLVEQADGE